MSKSIIANYALSYMPYVNDARMSPDQFFRTDENKNKSDRQHRDANISNQVEIHCHFIGDTNVSHKFVVCACNSMLVT